MDAVLREDALRQVLEVDLVDDADAGRHDLEAAEGAHAPLEELVAGAVAPELDVHVHVERVGRRPLVDLHGVIHDERDRDERLDDGRVVLQALDRGPHRGQIHEQRHAREVLEDDPGHHERDLGGPLGSGLPRGERPDVLLLDPLAVAVAHERLEDDPERDGKPGDRTDPVLEEGERVQAAAAAAAEGKFLPDAVESIHRRQSYYGALAAEGPS